MRTILSVIISADRAGHTTATRQCELGFAPTLGFEFEQTVWESPRKVVGVSWVVDDEYLYVRLEQDQRATLGDFEQAKEMYRDHGWEVR
jgi:hypothetical protein